MIPTARRIDQILTDTPLAASLLARLAAARQAARAIAPACAEIAPDFDPLRPGTCDLRGGVLRIWLRSSAHSTKLRQSIPRLLAILRSNNIEVSEIRVSVQLGTVREKRADKARITCPEGVYASERIPEERARIQKISNFSSKLALTLPDSELRRAIARFGVSIDAKLARMRDSDQSFDQQNRKKYDAGAQTRQEDTARPSQVAGTPADKVENYAGRDRDPEGEE